VKETLETQAFAENVPDRLYRVHGSGIEATGFNLGLRFHWKMR
jgi:hypothetical protein